MSNTLTDLANKYESDKGTIIPNDGKHHGPRLGFTPTYEKYLSQDKDGLVTLLEIGVGSGPSLKMWYEYFKFGEIHAIDIVDCSHHNNDRVTTHIANQTNRTQLNEVLTKIGKPIDIIIDDGGHMMGQQQISLGTLFKSLKSGGHYFIEDLHTSFWPINGFSSLYGQALDVKPDKSNSTVNMVLDYIKNKSIKSEFLTQEELDYLNNNIATCEIFDLGETMYGPNKLALFIKK